MDGGGMEVITITTNALGLNLCVAKLYKVKKIGGDARCS